jgi:DNA-binding FrmR family transcriptional regulator
MAHVSKDQQGNVILRDDWHIEDVRSMLDEGEELTDEECVQVLQAIADGFDANIGVNWEVIREHIEIQLEAQ